MKISVILAHPHKGSFNHAITAVVIETLSKNGHDVFFHDLYDEEFDPVLRSDEIPEDVKLTNDIKKHCMELKTGLRSLRKMLLKM